MFLLFCSWFTYSCSFENQVCVFWLLFHFLFCWVCFCWRSKGQVGWPEGPPHLALRPLYFSSFVWGFKGQVRWPERPPDLALNPPFSFLFCVCVFFFLSVRLFKRKLLPPPRRKKQHIFACLLSVYLAFSWAFFHPAVDSLSLSLYFTLPSFCLSVFVSFLVSLCLLSLLFSFLICCFLFFCISFLFVRTMLTQYKIWWHEKKENKVQKKTKEQNNKQIKLIENNILCYNTQHPNLRNLETVPPMCPPGVQLMFFSKKIGNIERKARNCTTLRVRICTTFGGQTWTLEVVQKTTPRWYSF